MRINLYNKYDPPFKNVAPVEFYIIFRMKRILL